MNEYDKQAKDFCDEFDIAVSIEPGRTSGVELAPAWTQPGEKRGRAYVVTLRSHRRHYSFAFWGSINDRERGIDPSVYDVLSCLSGDICCPSTFEEFCEDYGYNDDSIKDRRFFKRCDERAQDLREFFLEAEQTALADIV